MAQNGGLVWFVNYVCAPFGVYAARSIAKRVYWTALFVTHVIKTASILMDNPHFRMITKQGSPLSPNWTQKWIDCICKTNHHPDVIENKNNHSRTQNKYMNHRDQKFGVISYYCFIQYVYSCMRKCAKQKHYDIINFFFNWQQTLCTWQRIYEPDIWNNAMYC